MARSVILGNSSLTVGLNEKGLVHDFYYPYVGLENLTTSRISFHKIGVWVGDVFSWTDEDSWQSSVDFEADALVSTVKLRNEGLGVELTCVDFVDSALNVFYRRIDVANLSSDSKQIRLFMHQVFQISHQGRGDTALFVPEENYILDYKGRCCLLIYGQDDAGQSFDQFAVGSYGIEGKEGTFRDAEDGELSGSAVEHGGVDSVIRFSLDVFANKSKAIDYWIVAADSQFNAETVHTQIKHEGVEKRLADTRHFWQTWLSISGNQLKHIDDRYKMITQKSLMIIKAHTDKRGGVIASCDSSIYNYGRDYYSYVWPRDGAYAMWPLIRLGYTDEPRRFFEFCRDILTKDGYLMHKYQPDRAIGSTWHPLLHGKRKELAIQEDETAIVLYMLGEYYEYSQDQDFVYGLYETLIRPAAQFLAKFTDPATGLPHASYDLWEEKFATHTYTVATVYQALLVAADFAEMFDYVDDSTIWKKVAADMLENRSAFYNHDTGKFRKSVLLSSDSKLVFDETLDVSSVYGIVMFGYHAQEQDKIISTVAAIEKQLLDYSPSGGSPRYENDRYFAIHDSSNGNPWIVTTLWLAQYYHRAKQAARAKKYVDWAIDCALPSGVLSEQVNPENSQPLSVTPLVWSHAELINTILDIAK